MADTATEVSFAEEATQNKFEVPVPDVMHNGCLLEDFLGGPIVRVAFETAAVV